MILPNLLCSFYSIILIKLTAMPQDFAEIDGVKITRPSRQDIKPKAFQGKPFPLAMIAFSEPTDRYVLWFISNYPYAFNIFYVADFGEWMAPGNDVNQWPLSKHLKVVKSLMDRQFIKHGDEKRLTLKITFKGKIYRLWTNTTFQFWAIAITILLTLFGIFKDDIFKKISGESKPDSNKTTQISVQNKIDSQSAAAQIQPLKVKDSAVLPLGKTKN
jgi:hypothetical protein